MPSEKFLSISSHSAFPRIAPFVLYMAFIGIDEAIRFLFSNGYVNISETALLYLYPVKAVSVGILLIILRNNYSELRWTDLKSPAATLAGIVVGITVFLLWINMAWPWATFGKLNGFDPSLVSENFTRTLLITFRIFGAAVVVPIMEEIFWRSWLLRYIISQDFQSVEIGRFTFYSFIIGTLMFGVEHNLWLAGIMAGAFYSILLYLTKSIAQCIVAHGVTNLLLGIYVIQSRSWEFW